MDFRNHSGEHRASGSRTCEDKSGAIAVFFQAYEHNSKVRLARCPTRQSNRAEVAQDFRIFGGDLFCLTKIAVGGLWSGTLWRNDNGYDRALILVRKKLLGNRSVEEDGEGQNTHPESKKDSRRAKGGGEAFGVGGGETIENSFDPAGKSGRVIGFWFEKVSPQSWAEGQSDKSGDGN